MSGKPAARQGDMTAIGGPIVQGSLGVMIGAPTGVACSVCPGGVVSGSPVNPLLGAKVLPGETDLALPGPVPFVLSRTYSSYQTKTPAPVGIFGPGWKAPSDIRLQIRDNVLILNDNDGRSILFDPLFPGESAFSRNESFWLMRGGVLKLHDSNPLASLWHTLPETVRLSPHLYFATNSTLGPWWILGWAERAPSVDEVLPAPLPPYRVLTGLADNFGRTQRYQREADGVFVGAITTVTDGAGRRFRLNYVCMADMPQTRFGVDNGVRLTEIWLTHDPEYPQDLPAMPLVRYAYSPRGELVAVYDRSGSEVRAFTYDTQHPGRMVAHRYAGRPESRYEYDAAGRVITQSNPGGLSYAYAYEPNRVIITDSLHRREVLHTEGEGGLKRVVKKVFADGTILHSEFNDYGHLTAQTDALGRKTVFRLNIASGAVTSVTGPDGRRVHYDYNRQQQLTTTHHPDGVRSSREYDAQGRLVSETARSGDVTRYHYADPESDLPSAIEDATGSRKQLTWSRYGQLLTFTDCSGYQTRYEYDRFGQQTAVHREEGLSLSRRYDAQGRLVQVSDGQGLETRYGYSPAGDLTTVISPDGTRSETQYDTRGHAVSITRGGLTRQMVYDAAGRVTQLTNENDRHTTFAYDPMDRLTEETGFDGRTQRYHYDPGGRLTRSDDEDLITGWHYDESDRLSHRTVNGELTEQWLYDEHGWLESITHLSEGHPVAVHYGYDTRGRLNRERQTVTHPQTGALLWQHETLHGYHAGLINRVKPDGLPVLEWLTYGSGYLAGMKLGDTPLIEFTRDRLHRETQRGFGPHELTTTYTPGGHLQSRHLNGPLQDRDYGYDYDWNDAGALIRIRSPRQTKEYDYSDSGRLTQVRTVDHQQEHFLAYATDPAGNRLPDPQLYPHNTLTAWPDNRLSEDELFLYHHDSHGRLTEKTDRLTTAGYRADDRRRWGYEYDNQHRLVHCTQTQHHEKQTESRYVYDPLGRRIGKRVWHYSRHSNGQSDPAPAETWYGWDGDRLTTTQTSETRIQTVYLPGSFTPLLRVETPLTSC